MGALDETAIAPGQTVLGANSDNLAEINWQRWQYVKQRGHDEYTYQAARNENFYFGGSTTGYGVSYRGETYSYRGTGQWSVDAWQELSSSKRPSYTVNEIMPGINSAIGYQIHNRLDVSYRPRGGEADTQTAAIQSKVTMQMLDANKYHWLETQVFSDGLIEERGYFDIRMDFNSNVFGDARITVLDPRDVAPDPDAKTYNPNGWGDVVVSCWYTADAIEEWYGKEARTKAERFYDQAGDFGESDSGALRNKFGPDTPASHVIDAYRDGDDGLRRYRVIDRQRWVYELTQVAVYPTGDVKPITNASPEQIADYQKDGAVISKRMHRKVRWTVSTRWEVLYDGISPYDRFTVVPFFCYFRRGRTCGKVNNAIDPQMILNKSLSGFVHIVNTSANSGWVVEQNSLSNMTTKELDEKGSMTGLVLEYKQGATKPEKIEANAVPQGVDRLIDLSRQAVKNATVPDAMRGTQGEEVSGVAIQSRQFASQQELALPLDNLTYTRGMVADFLTYLKQTFYDNYRVFRITEQDPVTGKDVDNNIQVNKWNALKGHFENDLTVGDYDTVVDSVPMQVTFNNTQFTQTMEMKKEGVAIPDDVVVKYSNLTDKSDIIERMRAAPPPPDPTLQAKADLMQMQGSLAQANAALSQANAANIRMTTLFAATQAGQVLAMSPEIGPLADALAGSAGFQDQNAPPAVPSAPAGVPGIAQGVPPVARNTDPQFPPRPASPNVGVDRGIEGGR